MILASLAARTHSPWWTGVKFRNIMTPRGWILMIFALLWRLRISVYLIFFSDTYQPLTRGWILLHVTELTFMSGGGGYGGGVTVRSQPSQWPLFSTGFQHFKAWNHWEFLNKTPRHVTGNKTGRLFWWGIGKMCSPKPETWRPCSVVFVEAESEEPNHDLFLTPRAQKIENGT